MPEIRVTPIKTERDYEAALAEIDGLMEADWNTPEGDRLDVLVTLVEAYEARRWTIDPPDPIDALKERLERGLPRRSLLKIFGTTGRMSEIMNRRRPLSVEMMRRLHRELDIPAASFMRSPRRARRVRVSLKKRRRTA